MLVLETRRQKRKSTSFDVLSSLPPPPPMPPGYRMDPELVREAVRVALSKEEDKLSMTEA